MNTTKNSIFPEKMLGFGLMRLPKNGDAIDIERTAEMANEFLASGCTYFDTAYVYTGSEEAFRKAIAERHDRSEYVIANKLPVWNMNTAEDGERIFEESLSRCGIEYFDYYLIHAMDKERLEKTERLGVWEFVKGLKEQGRIKHLGFSFHDAPEVLDEILTKHPETEFVQLQLNYLDWDNSSVCSAQIYDIARKHGKEIIVMEPVKGGTLANLDANQLALLQNGSGKGSAASFALRFVGSLEGVSMILSGMSTQEQITDNLDTFADFKPISEQEEAAIMTVKEQLWKQNKVPCTACRYCCDGCPMEIDIPRVLAVYNEGQRLDGIEKAKKEYEEMVSEGLAKASACVECGQCEGACPQHIEVIKWLKRAAKMLEE